MNHSPSDSASTRLPANFICPACGYDLSGAAVERCSECGLEITEEIVQSHLRARDYLEQTFILDVLFVLAIFLAPAIIGAAYADVTEGIGEAGLLAGLSLSAVSMIPGLVVAALVSIRAAPRRHWLMFRAFLPMQLLIQASMLLQVVVVVALSTLEVTYGYMSTTRFNIIWNIAGWIGIVLLILFWKSRWKRACRHVGLPLAVVRDRSVRTVTTVGAFPAVFFTALFSAILILEMMGVL